MKSAKSAPVVFLTLLLLTAPARAQFEGTIDMKMSKTIDGTPEEVLYSMFVKKDMLAAQTRGGGEHQKSGKFIFRGDKNVLWVIDDDHTSYMELSLSEDAKQKRTHAPPGEEADAAVKLRKTGAAETILGYRCDEWVTGDTGKVTHIWGTSRLGSIYEALLKSFEKLSLNRGREEMTGWEGELARMKVFPLKIVTMEAGVPSESQEVTGIAEKPLAASTFEPPARYKKQSVDAGMGKIMEQLQEQLKSKGAGGDSMMNKQDLEKMMKELQERYKKSQKDSGDSSKGDD